MPYGTRGYGGMAVGDPFLGGLFKTIGKGLKFAGKIIPGPLGTAAKLGGGLLAPGRPQILPPAPSMPRMPGVTPFTGPQVFSQQFGPGAGKFGPRVDPRTGMPKRRRRMNPLNPQALSRATRRLAAYQRRNKQVEKQLRKIAPPRRSSRRDLPRGHTHVR